MAIEIPDRFQAKLDQEKWSAEIFYLAKNVQMYLLVEPRFFPDYTIHGEQHINKVLELANNLIPDNTLSKLSSRDISILIAAILIHDIGMFISEDGLMCLLFGKKADNKIEYLDNATWSEEWKLYLKKIQRYSDNELLNCFGSFNPIVEPPREINDMKRIDYLVYGEFIRRQHPRLAHYIATNTFPGTKDRDIFNNTGRLDQYRDIIGLIARSHGAEMRSCETYLSKHFVDIAYPNNIPIFYLMSVLRLADYLDAGEHRAPVELEDRQEIPVPISKNEWQWNQCINVENYGWSKSKSELIIHAIPDNTFKFIKIEQWLKSIRYELDISWAIISEKYVGNGYEFSIHRIQSNILNDETRTEFSKKFVTKETKLSANADLLKLLIRPLYGNNPSYGVRELIQNSVDACIERQHLEKKKNISYTPLVKVAIDSKTKIFTIIDNGIGMNEDTLLNYFLSVGSSYRFSDDWVKEFASEKGSEISRSGKFGIGVLASFLLGESIYVQTRWINDSIGYEFEFQMNQNIISIKRKECDKGTTIKIKLSDKTLELLKEDSGRRNEIKWFQWYMFKSPAVRYYIDNVECYKNRHCVPQAGDCENGWFVFNSKEYSSFQWQYNGEPKFYCNGIIIPKTSSGTIGKNTGLLMRNPSISLVDTSCKLRINLARSSVIDFPQEEDFIRELYKNYLAKLLISNKESQNCLYYGFRNLFSYGQLYFYYLNQTALLNYIFTEKGFTIFSAPFLEAAKISRLILFCYHNRIQLSDIIKLDIQAPFILNHIYSQRASIEFYKDTINTNLIIRSIKRDINDFDYNITSDLLYFWGETNSFNQIKSKLPKKFFNSYRKNHKLSSYYRFENINRDKYLSFVEDKLEPDMFSIIADYSINVKNKLENNIMLEIIREYLGDGDIWIPYRLEERQAKFPKAFKKLEKYMT